MKTTEMKKTIQAALKSEFGFAPALNQIHLLETYDDGKVISAQFHVNGRRAFKFDSTYTKHGVWVGADTVFNL